MKPLVERLKQEYEGKVVFKLYNIEKDPEGAKLANELGAEYVPTFVFYDSTGAKAGMKVGEVSEEEFRAQLDALK